MALGSELFACSVLIFALKTIKKTRHFNTEARILKQSLENLNSSSVFKSNYKRKK
jgi:hypothetical protein